jgi:predicted DNA binding CopG/RHH family protein
MRKININKIKLTKYEQSIEDEIDQYIPASKEENERIKKMIDAYKKDAILHMRINQGVLNGIKHKAAKLGVRYQTFIAEILSQVVHTPTKVSKIRRA